MTEWAELDGYGDRYDVSDDGQVRIRASGQLLKQTVRYDGYRFVSLQWRGGRDVKMVHSLVAEGHIGPRPSGALVRHLDGDRTHNSRINLAYGTHQENSDDARRHGVVATGEDNGQSRLTERGVIALRRLDGLVPASVIASWLKVSDTIICQARRGETWQCASGDMDLEEALRVIFGKQSVGVNAYDNAARLFEAYTDGSAACAADASNTPGMNND